ncbi:MAG: flagellar filament capping protein FliD [Desulfobacterota bacterium]|nr:flagellar filament capping protein FliD [Thermodesulfobacteriota bacterium]
MAESITFTGLGSGIDLESIVKALVDNEKKRFITPIETWKTSWQDKITAFQELNTKLISFSTAVKSLDTPAEFLVKRASVSDSTVLSATATSSAFNGSTTITINQLSQCEKEIHAGHPDAQTTAVTSVAGTFSYTYSGMTRTLTVPAGTTLSQLVKIINNDPQNPGVTASIIDDGSGTSTAFHLVLSGNNTGADYTITMISHTLNNFATGGTSGGGFDETQTAQNAQLKIDGYPATGWIERSTNTITDVLTGITMTLFSTGTTTITVSTDTAAIKENIKNFVNTFNEIRSYIKEKTAYNTATDKAGILLGNYAVDTIKNRLNAIVSSKPTGFRDGYDTYVNLMQIGIHTDADIGSATEGLLIIDNAKLDEALSENPDAVARLFSAYFTGRSAHAKLSYESYIDGITEPGTYEIKFIAGVPPSGQIRLKGTTEWHPATWDNASQTLTGGYGYPEAGLVVKITDPSTSFIGEVDLQRGIAGKLKDELDALLDSDDGPLAVLEDNYTNIIKSADNKIEFEEKRIAIYEKRLKERYARLESLLSELNNQMSYLSMRVQQLTQK